MTSKREKKMEKKRKRKKLMSPRDPTLNLNLTDPKGTCPIVARDRSCEDSMKQPKKE